MSLDPSVYKNGFLLRGKSGPSVTLWWLVVFSAVSVLHLNFRRDFYIIAVGTAVAYIMLRIDQRSPLKPVIRLVSSATLLIALISCLAVGV